MSNTAHVLEIVSISRFKDFSGIHVVALDEATVTFELLGAAPFLRKAEAGLMRSSTSAVLDGGEVLLRRSTWTQPIGATKLRVSCKYELSSSV